MQLIGALGGVVGIGALIDRWVFRRANRLKAEAEAAGARATAERTEIDGAERIAEIAIKTLLGPLETQVESLTRRLEETETRARQQADDLSLQLSQSRREVAGLSSDLATSRQEVATLTRYVELLIQELRRAELPVPPMPHADPS